MLHVNSTLSLFEISHTTPGTGFETFRGLDSSTSEAHQPRLVFGSPTRVPGIVRCFRPTIWNRPLRWVGHRLHHQIWGDNRDVVGYSSPRVRTSKNTPCFVGQHVYVHDHGFHLATHSWATCALNVTTPSSSSSSSSSFWRLPWI